MIIFIDGPTASGKTTITKELQKQTQWPAFYVGNVYRAIAKAYIEDNQHTAEEHAVTVCNQIKENIPLKPEKSEEISIVAAKLVFNERVSKKVDNAFIETIISAAENQTNLIVDGSNRYITDNLDALYLFIEADKEDRIYRQQLSVGSYIDRVSPIGYNKAKKLIEEKDAIDAITTPARITPLKQAVIIKNDKGHPDRATKHVIQAIQERANMLEKQCQFTDNGLMLISKPKVQKNDASNKSSPSCNRS